MLKKAELDEFRALLSSIQARLRGDVEQIRDGALEGATNGRESKSPTHPAELGSETYEQDFSLRVIENDQETLSEINDALKRIDEGTFGLCEMCLEEGRPASRAVINKVRLRAIPHARNCIECERKREEFT